MATDQQESTVGVLQNMVAFLAAGSVMFQHETNGGLKYMSGIGFIYDGYNEIAGINNFDGDGELEGKESLGDKIVNALA